MARRRIIDPAFWDDAHIGRLPLGARLAFQATWTLADDAGLLEADERRLRLFAFRYDNLTDAQVGRWLVMLEELGRLVRYEAQGRAYWVITRFHRHQTINRPTKSRLPRPPIEVLALLEDADARTVVMRTGTPSVGGQKKAAKTGASEPPLTEPHGAASEPHYRSEEKRSEVKEKGREENARARADDQKTEDGPPIPDDETEVQRLRRLETTVSDDGVRVSLQRRRERLEGTGLATRRASGSELVR